MPTVRKFLNYPAKSKCIVTGYLDAIHNTLICKKCAQREILDIIWTPFYRADFRDKQPYCPICGKAIPATIKRELK